MGAGSPMGQVFSAWLGTDSLPSEPDSVPRASGDGAPQRCDKLRADSHFVLVLSVFPGVAALSTGW